MTTGVRQGDRALLGLQGIALRTRRRALAEACFEFVPHRVALDLAGWPETDIFAH